MKEENLVKLIEDNYELHVVSIEKKKNTYKVYAKEGRYCVKLIKYQFPHFYFILKSILHLQMNGFETIPDILMCKGGEYYIKVFNKFAYVTKWIQSRESDYNNATELKMIAAKLGELHNCSQGFTITNEMKPRIGWFSWINVFETRQNEILDFKNRINQKAYKSAFDKLYLSVMDMELVRAHKSIEGLKKSNYINVMSKEVLKRGFCHHDYANHNVLIEEDGNINIIDFDYCILDTHIHDLSSLMIRAMKNGKWSESTLKNIINGYLLTNEVNDDEFLIMKEFIRFPQTYWQIGIQKYWEQQPWSEEEFLGRLGRYIEDSSMREDFIERSFI